MLKIILAPDSFKGSATAEQLCEAMARAVHRVLPDTRIDSIPMADGGEGTVTALVAATGGRLCQSTVSGPLGEPVLATWGMLGDGETAVIEMAAASGLPLVPLQKRNPLYTTTYGTGQLIRNALASGARKLVIGIGGSATTDCGCGMAQALGVQFLDADGRVIDAHMNGALLGQVSRMDTRRLLPLLQKAEITVACDVDNPLLGPRGAVHVYSPQKGAKPEELLILERNMEHIIGVIEETLRLSVRQVPGAGAAGGLGAGLLAFTPARLEPGIDLVLRACRFRERLQGADLVITGEGQVDEQTAYGKTVKGILQIAKSFHIPVWILAGSRSGDLSTLYKAGATAVFSICPGPVTLEHAMQHVLSLTEETVRNLLQVWQHRPNHEVL
jgi:glycerate kinase